MSLLDVLILLKVIFFPTGRDIYGDNTIFIHACAQEGSSRKWASNSKPCNHESNTFYNTSKQQSICYVTALFRPKGVTTGSVRYQSDFLLF